MNEKKINLISDKNLLRFMVLLVFVLALAGGYFHARLQTRERLYKNLERKYLLLQEKTAE